MKPKSNFRSCPTGKRLLSHRHGQTHPNECVLCRECGYYHAAEWGAALKTLSDAKPEFAMAENYVRAMDIRPMDRVELAGVFHTVTGYSHDEDGVVALDFENIQPQTFGIMTPLRVEKTLTSRENDQTLFQAIREVIKPAPLENSLDDFGDKAIDWMSSAINMLRGRQWAEQMPIDSPILCDLEVQISELVGRASRFDEVQAKFAAAVATLESLGYSYPVEGAAMWRPAHGHAPDYIRWEHGEIKGLPPVGAQIVYEYANFETLSIGKVKAIGDLYMLVSKYSGDEGETEEVVLEICDATIWPYSEADLNRAHELSEIMSDGSKSGRDRYLKLAHRLIKSGKI